MKNMTKFRKGEKNMKFFRWNAFSIFGILSRFYFSRWIFNMQLVNRSWMRESTLNLWIFLVHHINVNFMRQFAFNSTLTSQWRLNKDAGEMRMDRNELTMRKNAKAKSINVESLSKWNSYRTILRNQTLHQCWLELNNLLLASGPYNMSQNLQISECILLNSKAWHEVLVVRPRDI